MPPRGRGRILTVHGIATAGKWQEQLANAYAPHFECISIKYPHYRRLGALKLLLEPFVLALALVGIAALGLTTNDGFNRFGWLFTWRPVGLLLLAAYLATYLRRILAFNAVMEKASPYVGPASQQQTHLIAHSFGTYLAARALRTRPDFRLGRIVLVGCVLPRAFPWATLSGTGASTGKFLEVRNELARKDYVVYLAWLMSPLVRGLGIAGFRGFRGRPELIHDVPDPDISCGSCTAAAAAIHNVVSRDLGHSDTFVGSGYAETFWLPFLWGIDPSEYQAFLKYCDLAAGLEREWSESARKAGRVDPRLAPIETQLRAQQWHWTHGTFGEYVEREVLSRFALIGAELEQSVSLAVRGTWLSVMKAMSAHEARADRARARQPADPTADEAIAWMNPHLAVQKAVALL